MRLLKYLHKLFDKLLPPIRFKKSYFANKEIVTEEDMDRWATEFLERQEHERRQRGKHK